MTQKQDDSNMKQNRPNMGAAAVIGLTMGAMCIYFVGQCPAGEPRRGYPVQSQAPQPAQLTIRHESSTLTIPYNTKHNVGGIEFEYLRKDYGAEARVRYDITNGRIDTGMKLKAGATSTLPVNDSDLQVRITVNSIDDQRLNVAVTVENRTSRD